MFDLAVVGAGPAGCAAALRFLQQRPDASVVLLDAATFPRDKTCGDGIGPHVFGVFEELGASGLDAGFPPVRVLRLHSPAGNQAARVMARPARIIPRLTFDARLVEAACARGAELRQHRVRRIDVQDDRVVIDGSIHARVLVAADGAHSVIRRQLGLSDNRDGTVALAIRGYAAQSPQDGDDMSIAIAERDCPAYAWSFPLPDGRANVGFGVFANRVSGGRAELLDRLSSMLPHQPPDPDTVRAYQLPLSNGRPKVPDGRVLLTGDAASLINPITGEGIYYAALSGMLAADAAPLGHGAGARYRTLLRRHLGRHHRDAGILAYCARSARFADGAVAAAAKSQGVFDAIVELGLGDGATTPELIRDVGIRYLRELITAPRHRGTSLRTATRAGPI